MTMKRLGLIAVLALSMLAAPGAALAAGWSGHAGGWRGGGHFAAAPAPVYRMPGPRVVPAPGPRVYPAPAYGGYVRTYAPARTRMWVPGYWGLHGATRVWVAGAYAYPPFAGWVWVAPHWAWNGYQWFWQEGYWSAPY